MTNKGGVLQLDSYRELLSHWETVRERIVSGHVRGIHTAILQDQGEETTIAAGVYARDPLKAISAILNASATRVLAEDEPPLFQASQL